MAKWWKTANNGIRESSTAEEIPSGLAGAAGGQVDRGRAVPAVREEAGGQIPEVFGLPADYEEMAGEDCGLKTIC